MLSAFLLLLYPLLPCRCLVIRHFQCLLELLLVFVNLIEELPEIPVINLFLSFRRLLEKEAHPLSRKFDPQLRVVLPVIVQVVLVVGLYFLAYFEASVAVLHEPLLLGLITVWAQSRVIHGCVGHIIDRTRLLVGSLLV